MAETVKEPGFLQRDISFGKVFSDKLKEHFYVEFGSLLESGIDMRRAMQLLVEEQEKKKIKSILQSMMDGIISGMSLSDAAEKSGHFSPYEYQSIRIGEETGRLNHVLESLAQFYGDKVKLRRQLTSVFSYPAFVFSITLGVLYFMLNYVVPMFKDVFKQFGQDLPWLTLKIVWLSEHFSTFFMYFILGAGGIIGYCYTQRNEPWFRKASSTALLRLPIFGVLVRKIYIARFCQSMTLLMESKTPLVKALDLVGEMIRFYPMEEMLVEAKKQILAGNPLHIGLNNTNILDKRLISLIKISEEINQLDITFARLTKQYNEEISHRTKMIGTVLEPAIIVIIGLIVGLIMISMYMPMFNLSNVIK